MDYQTLEKYKGDMYGDARYQGIEYDWEVPDNLVVASPGGVDSIHHHWTKGFNGRGNASSDIYAGQGQRYNAGIYGNLYQTGQEAGQHMGYYTNAPDYQFWQNEEPPQYAYSHGQANPLLEGTGSLKKSSGCVACGDDNKEGFSYMDDGDKSIQLVEESDQPSPFNFASTAQRSSRMKVTGWIIFLIFFISLAANFWTIAGQRFMSQMFFGGRKASWELSLCIAFLLSAIFAFVLYMTMDDDDME